jgi:cytochrome c5
VRNYDLDFLKRFSMVIAFLMAVTLVLILFAIYLHHRQPHHTNPIEAKRIEARIAPAAGVYAGKTGEAKMAADVAAQQAAMAGQLRYEGRVDGAEVYAGLCASCHKAGVSGAPTLTAGGMGARAGKGKDTLYKHAIEGFKGGAGNMPAKGGDSVLTDDQVKAAVDYMLSNS